MSLRIILTSLMFAVLVDAAAFAESPRVALLATTDRGGEYVGVGAAVAGAEAVLSESQTVRLLPVDLFPILVPISGETPRVVAMVVFDAETGVRLADVIIDASAETAIETIARTVEAAAARHHLTIQPRLSDCSRCAMSA